MQERHYSFFTPNHAPAPIAIDNTPLHIVIALCKKAQEVITLVNTSHPDDLKRMVYTPNKAGNLPIHLVANLHLDNKEKEKIYNCLLLHMKPSIPSFKIPVDFQLICERHKIMPDDPRCEILKIACFIMNDIRKIPFLSSSHPDFNGENNKLIDSWDRTLEDNRQEVLRKKFAYLLASDEVTYLGQKAEDDYYDVSAHFTSAVCDRILQICAEVPLEEKIANCGELSDIFVYMLNKLSIKNIRIEQFAIGKGDHCIVVLNRNPKSAPARFKDWGDQALVVDIWAGMFIRQAPFPSNYTITSQWKFNWVIKWSIGYLFSRFSLIIIPWN